MVLVDGNTMTLERERAPQILMRTETAKFGLRSDPICGRLIRLTKKKFLKRAYRRPIVAMAGSEVRLTMSFGDDQWLVMQARLGAKGRSD